MGKTRAEAFVAAGFKDSGSAEKNGKRGSELLRKHAAIQARVEELAGAAHEDAVENSGLQQEFVIRELVNILNMCKEPEPVIGRNGQPTGELRFNAAGANKALELLGKTLGMFQERHVIEHLDAQLDGMTTDELRNQVAAAASEVGLRLVGMDEEQTREWIIRNAPRVGLRVEAVSEAAIGATSQEDGDVSAVPEGGGVAQPRVH
jgi:phage terminase small subunit